MPDIAGWRRERLPALPKTAWLEISPDCAYEILSPSTASDARKLKMPRYAVNGVAYCWLVDPTACTLEAFKLHEGQWLLHGSYVGEADLAVKPFDAVTFPLGALWAE